MKTYLPTLAAALCALAGCASQTTIGVAGEPAQQAYEERVTEQPEPAGRAAVGRDGVAVLDAQEAIGQEALAKEGYMPSGQNMFGQLGESQSVQATWKLERGRHYYVIGICDDDCEDLDLAIRDEDGRKVAADSDNDDVPIVTFRAPYSGKYTVQLDMEACHATRCLYRAMLYEKQTSRRGRKPDAQKDGRQDRKDKRRGRKQDKK